MPNSTFKGIKSLYHSDLPENPPAWPHFCVTVLYKHDHLGCGLDSSHITQPVVEVEPFVVPSPDHSDILYSTWDVIDGDMGCDAQNDKEYVHC